MAKFEKLVARLLSSPKDFNYQEAKTLLQHFGFVEFNKGKTSGSRIEFVKAEDTILLHKPHPNGDLKIYQVNQLIKALQDLKLI